ncbi:Werner helicase interacting protein 1 [Mycoemilia scoparia]|uniref:Werner helicase interacting protein 1 n=1 Tax=Mycoemilia scoparia TaxID=417184 RepID=A0A9W8A6W9_9FUNG|nr:Werner helicase interacting protein 1 [Mycoemilia scoparia]
MVPSWYINGHLDRDCGKADTPKTPKRPRDHEEASATPKKARHTKSNGMKDKESENIYSPTRTVASSQNQEKISQDQALDIPSSPLEMSAVVQSSQDVKKFIDEAFNITALTKKRVVLFIDEIHRFNKLQQDTFLPYVERGQIILIGATTENPSFKLNGALLSRCRTFVLDKLEDEVISKIAKEAIAIKRKDAGHGDPEGGDEADRAIAGCVARLCDGDARVAINIVDIAYDASSGGVVTEDDLNQALQRSHVLYGQEEHYDLISALHKSVRGSDDNAALYWLGRMLTGGDDPLYIARRLVRMASEDIGLADNSALPLAVAAFQACQQIGMPECDTILAHCVTYLARAPKSVESYKAYNRVKAVLQQQRPWPVPLHLRNAPTKLMKNLGYGKDYKYNPDYDEPVDQDYLPEEAKDIRFFD